MLDTIPFKRRSVKPESSQKTIPKNPTNHVHISARKKPLSKSTNVLFKLIFNPWFVISAILIIVVAGIVVLRISRATEGTAVAVPQNINSIQNYIKSVGGGTPQSQSGSLSGTIIFNYTPIATTSVSSVAFYLDNQLVGTRQKGPYQLKLDTRRYSNGGHTLTAVSFNSVGVPTAAIVSQVSFENPTGLLQDMQNTLTYPYYILFQL